MKISVNNQCPCGSGKKYKKCCQIYHKGTYPKDALTLMKARYTAYAIGDAKFIIKTTHKENSLYEDDLKSWEKSIKLFSDSSNFLGLRIISYKLNCFDAKVEFIAKIDDNNLHEISYFKKENNKWLYLNFIIK